MCQKESKLLVDKTWAFLCSKVANQANETNKSIAAITGTMTQLAVATRDRQISQHVNRLQVVGSFHGMPATRLP